MSVNGAKKEQLVEEFHVEVYSSGRIKWDRLDAFISAAAVDRDGLMAHLRRKLKSDRFSARSLAA
jgi:hypothetical protein